MSLVKAMKNSARFAGRVIVLARGRVVAAGSPDVALTGAVVERVFEWPVDVLAWRGTPQFVPVRRRDAGGLRGRNATEGNETR